MNRKKVGILLFFAFLANLSVVFAQSTLAPMFQSLSNLGLIGSVDKYPYIWDAILFITLFVALGRIIFKDRFSPQAGGVIGFVLSIIMISGELTLKFSVVRELGPWFLIGGVIALVVFLVRIMFQEDGNNRTGAMAFGVFIVLTLILNGLPNTGNYLSTRVPLLFSLLMLAQVIALVFSVIWFFRIIGNRGGGDGGGPGGFGNWLGRRADGINSARDGGRRLRDAIRGRPTQDDINRLAHRIQVFQGEVARFGTQTNNLISFIGPQGTNRSTRVMNMPLNQYAAFNMQINNQLSQILPFQARLVTEAASIMGERAFANLTPAESVNFVAANNQFIVDQANLANALT